MNRYMQLECRRAVVLWWTVNLADLLLTWACLGLGMSEGNPVMLALGIAGMVGVALYKVLSTLLVGGLLFLSGKLRLLQLVSCGLVVVCLWNLVMLMVGLCSAYVVA